MRRSRTTGPLVTLENTDGGTLSRVNARTTVKHTGPLEILGNVEEGGILIVTAAEGKAGKVIIRGDVCPNVRIIIQSPPARRGALSSYNPPKLDLEICGDVAPRVEIKACGNVKVQGDVGLTLPSEIQSDGEIEVIGDVCEAVTLDASKGIRTGVVGRRSSLRSRSGLISAKSLIEGTVEGEADTCIEIKMVKGTSELKTKHGSVMLDCTIDDVTITTECGDITANSISAMTVCRSNACSIKVNNFLGKAEVGGRGNISAHFLGKTSEIVLESGEIKAEHIGKGAKMFVRNGTLIYKKNETPLSQIRILGEWRHDSGLTINHKTPWSIRDIIESRFPPLPPPPSLPQGLPAETKTLNQESPLPITRAIPVAMAVLAAVASDQEADIPVAVVLPQEDKPENLTDSFAERGKIHKMTFPVESNTPAAAPAVSPDLSAVFYQPSAPVVPLSCAAESKNDGPGVPRKSLMERINEAKVVAQYLLENLGIPVLVDIRSNSKTLVDALDVLTQAVNVLLEQVGRSGLRLTGTVVSKIEELEKTLNATAMILFGFGYQECLHNRAQSSSHSEESKSLIQESPIISSTPSTNTESTAKLMSRYGFKSNGSHEKETDGNEIVIDVMTRLGF